MIVNITENENGTLLRDYLKKEIRFSSKQIKKMKFSDGGITVNGAHVTVRYVLRAGDVLALKDEDTADDVNPYIVPGDVTVDILLEDESLTVIGKPAGVPSHPSLGHKTDTVANALAKRYEGTAYVFRPVNRLDRDTSGVMITANTRLASCKMFRQLKNGEIKKRYIAVLDGVLPDKSGRIMTYIKRAADSIMERTVCDETDEAGKIAVTEYETVFSDGNHSVVLAEPVTGRTHQLRVHFASRGCPITGDTMYGSASDYIARHALHALSSEFAHPDTNQKTKVTAPLPDDMVSLIRSLFSDSDGVLETIGKL